MFYTKRDLLEAMKDYPDDILVEIGFSNSEPGTQHQIVDVVYATGAGRCKAGQSCLIIEQSYNPIESEEDSDVEELQCEHCGTIINKCPKCEEDF
jgi:hypothetical protein